MINVFHASQSLLSEITQAENERVVIEMVTQRLADYQLATRVKHSELDVAFAATGGPSNWLNGDNMTVAYSPSPERPSQFGDILVEQANGFVNLSTPMGFIPLIDIVELTGELHNKRLN